MFSFRHRRSHRRGVHTHRGHGDTLVGTFSGQTFPTDNPFAITLEHVGIVTGGTGRFGGATGEFAISGGADLYTSQYSQTLSGTVSSPGAARN